MTRLEPGAVHGTVDAGFEPVREAFAASVADGSALGAATSIWWQGRCVVDLWGGWADRARTRPWVADDVLLVYSLTKGMTGLAAAMAVSRGLFSYRERVADVWPEFAANGKADMLIGTMLSEQGGLAAPGERISVETLGDQAAIAAISARQAPNWTPGQWAGNHPYSLGWLTSELIRRRDPGGRTLGQYFADEIARPLGADFYIGLPADFPRERLARIDGFTFSDMFIHRTDMPWRLLLGMLNPFSLPFRALNNPLLWPGPGAADTEVFWSMGQGGMGGVGNARAIAAVYEAFGSADDRLGLTRPVLDALAAGWDQPSAGRMDQILFSGINYSLGLEKPSAEWPFAPSTGAFGSFALGGSFAFADPDNAAAYAWVTNRLGTWKRDDPREKRVRQAFYRVIGKDIP